jgi:hypothetical protein
VPARASIATGRPVYQTRNWENSLGYDGRLPGWGHRLQGAGHRVESIGKLHFKSAAAPTGFDIQHQPMHLKQGIDTVWGAVRDPLPDFPEPWRMFNRIGQDQQFKDDAELFDLKADPQETRNLAGARTYAQAQLDLSTLLHERLDPISVDRQAKSDQAALVERFGGRKVDCDDPGAWRRATVSCRSQLPCCTGNHSANRRASELAQVFAGLRAALADTTVAQAA